MGSLGELEIDMLQNCIFLHPFGRPVQTIRLDPVRDKFAGHGGGDDRLMDAFVEMLRTEGTEPLTSIDVSIDSHIRALAAEASRLHGGKNIVLSEFAAQV